MAEREQIIQRVRERLIEGTLTEDQARQVLAQVGTDAPEQPAQGSGLYAGPGPMTPQQMQDRRGLADITAPVLDPVWHGGQQMFTGLMQNVPMPQGARDWLADERWTAEGPPENLVDAGLRGVGDMTFWTGLGTAALTGRAGMAAAPHLSALQQGGNVAQAGVAPAAQSAAAQQGMGPIGRAGQGMLDSMRNAPGTAAFMESLAGFGAGAGGLLGRQSAEQLGAEGAGAVALESGGGLLGGYAGASMPGAGPRAAMWAGDRLLQNVLPYTRQGAAPRAAGQLQRDAQDPEGAAALLESPMEGVTPGRQTGDPGLMAREERILADNPQLRRQVDEGLARAQADQERSARQLFGSTRSQGEWELEVMQRAAAPGAEIQPGDPEAMLTQAFESFQPAYNAVRGQSVSGEGLGARIEQAIRNTDVSASTQARDRVAREVNGRLETLAARAGEGTGLTSDDLLDLRHAVRTDARNLSRSTDADAQERRRLLQDVEQNLTGVLDEQLPPELSEQLRAVDGQYRQHKVVENAVYRSGERGLDPQKLSEAIRQSAVSEGQFARGGDAELRSLALTGWPMDQLLGSPQIARRATSGLSDAERQPLKANAAEYLTSRARSSNPQTGESYLSGPNLRRVTSENAESLREIGFNDSDIARMNSIADNLITIQRPAPSPTAEVLDDTPAFLMRGLARLVGSTTGSRIAGLADGGGMANRLVMAQMMSKEAQDRLANMTTGMAEAMLTEAITDPQLYRALLTGPTSTRQQQREAAQRLQGWLLGETERAGSGMLEEVEPGFVTQPDGTETPAFNPGQ